MAYRLNLTFQTADRRIDVSQQFVAQRNVLADNVFQFAHLNIRIVDLRQKADRRQPIDRHGTPTDILRAAEEIALEVRKTQGLAFIELFPGLDLLRDYFDW